MAKLVTFPYKSATLQQITKQSAAADLPVCKPSPANQRKGREQTACTIWYSPAWRMYDFTPFTRHFTVFFPHCYIHVSSFTTV